MKRFRHLWKVLGLIFVVSVVAHCNLGMDRYEGRHTQIWDIHDLAPVMTDNAMRISTQNGSVNVTGYDGDHIRIDARKVIQGNGYNDVKAFGESLTIQFEHRQGVWHFWVDTEKPNFVTSIGLSMDIRVPKAWINDLKIGTSNGTVTVDNLDAILDIQSSNGGVTVRDTTSRLEIQTSNGRVSMDRVRLIDGHSTIRTSNGQISFTGHFPESGILDWRTSNGRITVDIPKETSMSAEMKTSNGTIQLPNLIFRSQQMTATHFKGAVNEGGPLLFTIVTSNGDITLRGI